MGQIAAEALIGRLSAWGVDTVFGIPGDGINGIMEGLRRNADKIRFVLVHHEEAAAFMATAYAKATGTAWRLSGDVRARAASICSTGSTTRSSTTLRCWPSPACRRPRVLGTGLPAGGPPGPPVRRCGRVQPADHQPGAAARPWSTSPSGPRTPDEGVAHLTMPNDIQVADAGENPWPSVAPAHVADTPARSTWQPAGTCPGRGTAAAAEVLNAGEKVAILVGIGARGCGSAVERLADTLGAPIDQDAVREDGRAGRLAVRDRRASGCSVLRRRPSWSTTSTRC